MDVPKFFVIEFEETDTLICPKLVAFGDQEADCIPYLVTAQLQKKSVFLYKRDEPIEKEMKKCIVL